MKKLLFAISIFCSIFSYAQSGALRFDGVDDYLHTLGNMPIYDEFSVEIQVNFTTIAGTQYLFGKNSSSGLSYSLQAIGNNLIAKVVDSNNDVFTVAGSSGVSAGGLFQIVMTYQKGVSLKLYVNGSASSSTSVSGLSLRSDVNSSLIIGAQPDNVGSANKLVGTMDEFYYWTRALSQTEIQSRQSCQISTTTAVGLLINYDFNQGIAEGNNTSINNVINKSSGIYNASITGFARTGTGSNFVAGNSYLGSICGEFLYTDMRVKQNNIAINNDQISASTLNGTNFGIQNGDSFTQTFVIENNGLSTVTISSINFSNSAFTHTLTSDIIVPNATTTLIIGKFFSVAPGSYTSTVTINSNDHKAPAYNFAIAATFTAPGTGLSFDGDNDFVNIPYSSGMPAGNSDFTFEAFIKPLGGQSGVQWFASLGNTNANQGIKFGVDVDLVSNFYQIIANNNNEVETISIPGFSINFYNHIAFTYKAATKTLTYIQNSIPEPSITFTSNLNLPSAGNLQLGTHNSDPNFAADVVIDEIRIWNRSMTFNEINSRNACSMTNTILGIAAHYDFNQNLAYANNAGKVQLLDRSGNGKNGTLTNFSLTGVSSNWSLTNDSPLTLYNAGTCPTVSGASFSITGNGNLIPINSTVTSVALGNDFGTRLIDQTIVKTFRIVNGAESIQLTGINSNDPFDHENFNFPLNIPANGFLDINISFTGVSLCQEESFINIQTNSIIIPEYSIPVSSYTEFNDYIVTGNKTVCGSGSTIITVSGAQILTVGGILYPMEYSLYNNSNQLISGPITLSGTGPFTFATPMVTSTTGFYVKASLGYVGSFSCTKTLSGIATIVVGQQPTVTGTATPNKVCLNETITFTGAGASTYTWSDGIINRQSYIANNIITIVTVTGTSNGCSNTALVNLTVNSLPSATIQPSITTFCIGQTYELTASGINVLSYLWMNGATTSSINFTCLSTNTPLSVEIKDNNGCSGSDVKGRVGTEAPTLSTILNNPTYKSNYNQPTGQSGFNYSLTSGLLPQGISLNATNGSISGTPIVLGISNFTITGDSNGSCPASKAYTITVNPALLTVAANDVSVFQFTPFPSQFTSSITGLAQGENITINYLVSTSNTDVLGNFAITPSVSGAALNNYILTTIAGTLRVTSPQMLTATVGNLVREFGNPDPAFTGTVVGILPQFSNVTVSYFTNTSATSGFGVYPILATLTGTDAFRYSLSSLTVGGLTIRTRRLIVRTYDYVLAEGQPFPVTYPTTIIGLLSGSVPKISFDTEAIPNEPKRFNIIPEIEGIDLNLYSLVLFPGVLSIRPAITLAGNNFSKMYGQANPALTGQMTGMLLANPYVYVSFETVATPNSAVGDYTIYPVVSGSDASKYGYVTVLGMLSVNKANLTVAAANLSRDDNDASPFAFAPVFTGLANNDAVSVSFATDAPNTSTIGTNFSIFPSPSGTALDNYNLTTLAGRLQILTNIPAIIPITVSANNFTKKYGTADGNYTFITIGNINSSDNITVSVQSNAQPNSRVGTYTLTPKVSGTDIYKYSITTVAGALTIEKNTVTIQALDYVRGYGNANPPFFNVSFSGLLYGDQMLAVAFVNENQFSNTGTYPIFVQTIGAISPNYTVQTVAGTLTINKAVLTVIGGVFVRMYNKPNPSLAFNIVGYKGADRITVIDKLPIGQTTAIVSSPVQAALYPVIYSQAEDNNYDFSYNEGSLKIIPSTQTIRGYNLFARVKTGESVTLTANASSGLPLQVSIVDTAIVKNTSLLMNGRIDGQTFIKVKQNGDNNYLPADSILIAIVSTSTGIKTTTLIGIFGSRSMFKGVQSTFQSTEVPGYKYKWSYRPSAFVPRAINWVNALDTTTTKVSIVFPKNVDVVLPSTDSSRVHMGDITCKVYDDLGNLSKENTISLLLNIDAQAAAVAQLAQTLAVLECPPAVSNCSKTFISTFNFGKRVNDNGTDKTDKSCNGGFSDFTTSGRIDTLIMGNPYNFKIGATVAANTSSLIFFALWIDYDNNGSFNDPDDFIRASSEATNLYEINSMAIRNNDKYEGPRRIRISMKTSKISPSESCLAEGVVGETEDYMVFLKKPQALEIANLLTPNNDGKNDIFIIKGINPKLTNKLTIMDRDGLIKYQTENYQNDFDGNSTENRLQDGTYYYYFSQGEDNLKGFVELKRK